MAPANHRTLLKQPPSIDSMHTNASPLKGELQFPNIPPMVVETQQWDGEKWSTFEVHSAPDLASAIRLARLGTFQLVPDGLQSIGT